jgi:hypothetical protein
MKKRLFLVLGLLAFFLVLITGLTGCDSGPSYKYDTVFNNRSSYSIQVDIDYGYDISPRSFTIRPGSSQTVGWNTYYGYNNEFNFTYHRADGGNNGAVYWDKSTKSFYNR